MKNSDFNPQGIVAIDTETTGLRHWHKDEAFAVGMCDEQGNTWYCEWPVDPYTRKVYPDEMDVAYIRSYTDDPNFIKVFHNANFDSAMLGKAGISLEGEINDTHIMARVCNNVELSLGLKPLATKYLKLPSFDERELKQAVNSARRQADRVNRDHERAGESKRILKGDDPAQDYWMPRHFDPENDACGKYCRLDTVRTMGLYLMYTQVMDKDDLLRQAYDFEMFKVWPVVKRMISRGIRIDEDAVKIQRAKAYEDLNFHHNAMVKMIEEKKLRPFEDGTDPFLFNPSSTKQLRRVLYLPEGQGGLGLSTHRECPTGELSTDKKALRELMSDPFVRHLVQYRAAEQSIGLFFDKFIELMSTCPITGEKILRPGLNQCGTVTFRFSCSDPNLQQVGSPDTAGNAQLTSYRAREPFGPRKGYVMYTPDYSQQELRIYAAISQSPFLLREIRAGNDPNSACANRAWGGKNNPAALKAAAYALDLGNDTPANPSVAEMWKKYDWNASLAKENGFYGHLSQTVAEDWLAGFNYDIVKAEKSVNRSNSRGRAKCVVFAKLYGGGPSSVTELLYCSLSEAKSFMAEYDRALPEINEYMSHMVRQARKDGYIINPYGRKIRVEQDFAYRAVNYMIQSTAACMMKDAIVRCDDYLRGTGLDAHILIPIHDELIFEIYKEHTHKWLLRQIVSIMSDSQGRLSIPIPVEIKRCVESWDKKEAIEL